MAAANNAQFITIKIRNMAGNENEIRIREDIPVYLLRLKILLETTESGYPFVEGHPFSMKLYKQTNNTTRVYIDNPNMTLNNYGITNGDTLYIVMENRGGKLSRPHRKSRRHCKSYRHCKSRGKKSRKH